MTPLRWVALWVLCGALGTVLEWLAYVQGRHAFQKEMAEADMVTRVLGGVAVSMLGLIQLMAVILITIKASRLRRKLKREEKNHAP